MTLTKFLKGIVYTSLAIVPAIAWYVSESSFFPFISGKGFAFRAIIDITLVAWVALACYEPAYRPKRSLVFFSYSAFLIIIFVANMLGTSPYLSFFGNYERMEGWFTHLHLFLYFTILYSVYRVEQDWSRMFGWFTAAAIAIVTEGLFQLFGQKDFFLVKNFATSTVSFINTAYPTHMGGSLRLDSTLGNSEYYAVFTLLFVFISLLLAFKAGKWRGEQNFMSMFWIVASTLLVLSQNFLNLIANNMQANNLQLAQGLATTGSLLWIAGIIALVFTAKNLVNSMAEGKVGSWPFALFAFINLVSLLYTQTRGAYVGLVIGLFTTMACLVLFGRKQYKKLAKFSAIGLVSVVILVGAFFVEKDSAFVQSSLILKRIATINIPSVSSASNVIQTGNYEEMVKVFGETTIVSRILNIKMSIVGISQSVKTFFIGYGQENYSTVFSSFYDPRMYAQEVWFDRAHNVFMDWLVAGGILGLFGYLALYLTPIYMMWRGKGRGNIHIIEKSILTGLLSGYFVHNIFVFDNLVSYIIFIALLAYIASRTRDTEQHIKAEDSNHKHLGRNNKYLFISAASIFSLVLFVTVVLRPLMTNLDIISGFKNFPTSYANIATSTPKSFNYFKSAFERNTFGSNEVMEQMIQKSAALAQVDLSKMPTEEASSTRYSINQFRAFAENNYSKMIQANPTARNTSFFGSYLRQVGNISESLKYIEQAYNISPTKQIIAYEYANALAVSGKNAEALAIVKKAYESDISNKQARDVYEALLKASQPATSTSNSKAPTFKFTPNKNLKINK